MQVGVVTTRALGLTETGQETSWLRTLLEVCTRLQQTTTFRVYCAPEEEALFGRWSPRVIADEAPAGFQKWFGRNAPAWQSHLAEDRVQVAMIPFAAPYPLPCPAVRYALQLSDWEDPQQAKAGGPVAAKRALQKAMPQTHRVIVTSKYLQQRLLELFEVPLEKIRVAPAGTDPLLEKEQGTFIEPPYLVCYCDAASCGTLVKMVPKIWERFQDILQSIVITGPGAPDEPAHWGEHVLRVESIPLLQRAGLYRAGTCFFYPHRYDGACVPSVEAMRAGVPVLSPVSGAARELLGDAPLFYNPDSKDSLFQNLRRVFQEPAKERARRVELGRQLARAKSWDQCAWEVLSTFKVSGN
ncbi:MAG: glycosyltransferase [Candidatus Hydrogenedentes bacterium]|nr:glycosyltransferase [Candidatus Hydrogenedentota bacterium]